VQQLVPQRLRLGQPQLSIQGQRLRPSHQRLRHHHQLQPHRVALKGRARQVACPGVPGATDAVLDMRMLPMRQIQPRQPTSQDVTGQGIIEWVMVVWGVGCQAGGRVRLISEERGEPGARDVEQGLLRTGCNGSRRTNRREPCG
jgi:hypothetical protein